MQMVRAGNKKKIEIGLLAEINLAAQDAHRAKHGHDNGGETYVNHHFGPFFIINRVSTYQERCAVTGHRKRRQRAKRASGTAAGKLPFQKWSAKVATSLETANKLTGQIPKTVHFLDMCQRLHSENGSEGISGERARGTARILQAEGKRRMTGSGVASDAYGISMMAQKAN